VKYIVADVIVSVIVTVWLELYVPVAGEIKGAGVTAEVVIGQVAGAEDRVG
jgi:hypothetical protein